jgi:hypothetical protein
MKNEARDEKRKTGDRCRINNQCTRPSSSSSALLAEDKSKWRKAEAKAKAKSEAKA